MSRSIKRLTDITLAMPHHTFARYLMHRTVLAIFALLVVLPAAGITGPYGNLGFGSGSVAHAAGTAEEIHLHTYYGYYADIMGYNQYGNWVSHWVSTPYLDTWVSGWWWTGTVQVAYYDYYGHYMGSVFATLDPFWVWNPWFEISYAT